MCNPDYDYNFKLSFKTEWLDPAAQVKRQFLMGFYPSDNTVDLYDITFRKSFLKRSFYENLRLKDLYLGNTITIYDRLIKILDYADSTTKNLIGTWKQFTFAIIKPSGMPHLGDILNEIHAGGFTIEQLRMCKPPREEVIKIYRDLQGIPQLPFILDHMCSAPVVAMSIVGENAIQKWREMMGPMDSLEAKKTAPASIRARFGYDLACNVVHGSETYEKVIESSGYFFPREVRNEGVAPKMKPPPNTARLQGSTCCIVKPHAVDEGKLGRIINVIVRDFDITAIQMYHMCPENVEEFVEVYKGVIKDYHSFLRSFMNGACVAMEISRKAEDSENRDVHGEFRRLCGPMDCDVAKNIRPNTLRAMFGNERYFNAVHCTDLEECCEQELEYFFKILDN